jgi:hypothetical protein
VTVGKERLIDGFACLDNSCGDVISWPSRFLERGEKTSLLLHKLRLIVSLMLQQITTFAPPQAQIDCYVYFLEITTFVARR